MGRGQRSAIGTWTFAGGGLVVEGGRRAGSNECGPLIARLPFPETWRCVVVVPEGPPGISGADEADAFARLPKPSEQEVEHVSHLVLMALLPALADGDLGQFGRALSEIRKSPDTGSRRRRAARSRRDRVVPSCGNWLNGERPASARARGAPRCMASWRAQEWRRSSSIA